MAKDRSLDGLRGLAALTVVLGHSLFSYFPYLTSRRVPYEGATPTTIFDAVAFQIPFNLLYVADAAVVVFFVLSGYVLTLKYFPSRDTAVVTSAATRRYIRLILPAAFSVVFAWALLSAGLMGNHLVGYLGMAGWPIHFYTEPRSLWDALLAGFFYVPLVGETYFNGPLWSITVEFLGSMLLFISLAVFGRAHLILVAVLFIYAAKVLTGNLPTILYYVAILSGAMLHQLSPWLKANPGPSAAIFLVGLVLVAVDRSPQYAWLLAVPLPNLSPMLPDFSNAGVLVWQTVGAIFLVAGLIGSRFIARFIGARPVAYLGRISFAVYLLHMPLIMSLMMWSMYLARIVLGWGFLASFAFSFTIFIVTLGVLAELVTRFVDGPAIRLSRLFEEIVVGRREQPPALPRAAQPQDRALGEGPSTAPLDRPAPGI